MGLSESEAIILRTYNLAEADKVVVCLTRNSGVIRAVARGARRLKSRFGAGLEPFTIVALTYYEKEGRELVSLRQAEIVRSHFDLSYRTDVVAALAYMGELVMEFAPPHEPNERIYRMFRAVLDVLSTSPDQISFLVRYFEIWILKLAGFMPDLNSCSECHKKFDDGARGYPATDMRILCASCRPHSPINFSAISYNYLRAAQSLSPKKFVDKGEQDLSDKNLAEIGSLTSALIRRALERSPRTLATLS